MKNKLDRIIHGDCIKHLQKLDAGSVDLVFADPPFNIGYKYDEYDDRRTYEDYLNWSGQWINEIYRVLHDDGTFWLAIGDDFAAELKVLATREVGFTCRSWVVWYYTFGVHCTHKFTRSHTHLFYFTKHPKKFTFNANDIRVPSARQLVYGDKRANPRGRVPDDTWIIPPVDHPGSISTSQDGRNSFPPLQRGTEGGKRGKSKRSNQQSDKSSFILRPQDIPNSFEADSDTWYFPRVCGTFKERGRFHGCQMPEQLLGRIVKACSNDGDVVLDPFAGSGTTLAVARKLDRRYLGIELSKEYITQMRSRLRKIKVGDPLDGFENPLTTVPNTINGTIRNKDGKRVKLNGRSDIFIKKFKNLDDYSCSIIAAFINTHQGFSTDRLLADYTLNNDFINACEMLSLPGNPEDWNKKLLGLRKANKLPLISNTGNPKLNAELVRKCQFASEIAWKYISDCHSTTLDGIFCNPKWASEFDKLASMIAPGHPSIYYRWAAFYLRKKAKDYRGAVSELDRKLTSRRFTHSIDFDSHYARTSPSAPGIYFLHYSESTSNNTRAVYIGETNDLKRWAEQFGNNLSNSLSKKFNIRGINCRHVVLDDNYLHIRQTLKCYHVTKRKPLLNHPDYISSAA